ncbi:ParB/RepB/Spo0J family partition protein [Candidatus Dojkabacteria bacterium]|uniref:ParB/RepB/Spo0J family partition protein n=1 Tax=Candidatus Dojkabacteria bacterium TaxID=2099670 RepID=A0A3M0Z5C6_9BACT|nr:MAG: ParB/RepB/Spo0J family partition protein [Candidatus Dojkabacteria bacterium]
MSKVSSLGRGLSALIKSEQDITTNITNGYIPKLPVNLIKPNRYQPRIEIKPESLVELADSIREHGIIEPLIVTKINDKEYELIAGERRLRAAKLAGFEFVPVVVKESTPQQMLEIAIVENVQRSDLNPLEEAMAFEQLVKIFGQTHEEISKKVGISRPAVANKLRLLTLPEEVKRCLLEQKISEGHARALLGLSSEDQIVATLKVVIRNHLSVRAVEELVRRINKGKTKPKRVNSILIDEKTIEAEKILREKFGEKVSISRSSKGGKITIPFEDDEELENILDKIVTI